MTGTAPKTPEAGRRRVLFVAEAVTLAHVARPCVLAQALDRSVYDVHFACHPRYRNLLGDLPFTEHSVDSIDSNAFLAALAKGTPLYDSETLRGYVTADLALLEKVRPDLVVGDFRLSLSVSARLFGVPYATITNAYWSPFYQQRYRVPDLPLVRALGPVLGQGLFSLFRPLAFALHTLPLNRVRREKRLPSLGLDLRRTYTDADHVLYADAEAMFSLANAPANHHFLGPVTWSPALPLPPWWHEVPTDRPVIYVNLGSSGPAGALAMIVAALARQPVSVVVATAGGKLPAPLPANVFAHRFLPNDAAIARASLVVCNGGSITTYQSLLAGVPLIGIASNLDQYLNMTATEQLGAGVLIRSDRVSEREVCDTAARMLTQDEFRAAASAAASQLSPIDPDRAFATWVDRFFAET